VNTISEYLFDELGFRGNYNDYYDSQNSFLNKVMERRLGTPITLSLLYIEVGARNRVPLMGVGMPGHFLVKHRDIPDLFIDPFHNGILLSEEECVQRLKQATQGSLTWNPRYLEPIGSRDFIARMLRNLKVIYLQRRDYERVLSTIDRLLALQPQASHERRDRGVVHYRLGNYEQALGDLQDYAASSSPTQDSETVQRLIQQIQGILGS
jgi:regulator of sirC expression with transglutaminase-like and TPR domain